MLERTNLIWSITNIYEIIHQCEYGMWNNIYAHHYTASSVYLNENTQQLYKDAEKSSTKRGIHNKQVNLVGFVEMLA